MAFLFAAEARWGIWISAIIVVIGSTLLEGTAVGWFQWSVLRRVLPSLSLKTWWLATAIGAFIAWTLGMIPSTFMASMEEAAAAGPPPEPSDLLLYTAAAGMGLVLGPILGLPQWWVLRRYVNDAWLWLPANAIAWAWGMIVIFAVVGMVAEIGFNALAVALILGGLLLAGAVVGAFHGYVLVKLLRLY